MSSRPTRRRQMPSVSTCSSLRLMDLVFRRQHTSVVVVVVFVVVVVVNVAIVVVVVVVIVIVVVAVLNCCY